MSANEVLQEQLAFFFFFCTDLFQVLQCSSGVAGLCPQCSTLCCTTIHSFDSGLDASQLSTLFFAIRLRVWAVHPWWGSSTQILWPSSLVATGNTLCRGVKVTSVLSFFVRLWLLLLRLPWMPLECCCCYLSQLSLHIWKRCHLALLQLRCVYVRATKSLTNCAVSFGWRHRSTELSTPWNFCCCRSIYQLLLACDLGCQYFFLQVLSIAI